MCTSKTLVNYSSSDCSDEELNSQNDSKLSSQSAKLVLPQTFFNNTKEDDLEYEDSNQHEGRIRNFPHERGIWTTYVFAACAENDVIESLCKKIQTVLEDELNIACHSVKDLHLSLTRTVVLRHHWINSFITTVKDRLINTKRLSIKFSKLKVYSNDEKTRTFIGLSLDEDDSENLREIVTLLDKSLKEFKLPEFYEDPSFHISILWCLGDVKCLIENDFSKLSEIFLKMYQEEPDEFLFYICQLYCKSGNKLFKFLLL